VDPGDLFFLCVWSGREKIFMARERIFFSRVAREATLSAHAGAMNSRRFLDRQDTIPDGFFQPLGVRERFLSA
jgi:hypothetical protein